MLLIVGYCESCHFLLRPCPATTTATHKWSRGRGNQLTNSRPLLTTTVQPGETQANEKQLPLVMASNINRRHKDVTIWTKKLNKRHKTWTIAAGKRRVVQGNGELIVFSIAEWWRLVLANGFVNWARGLLDDDPSPSPHPSCKRSLEEWCSSGEQGCNLKLGPLDSNPRLRDSQNS